jgi:hypothetical protein
MVTKNAPKSVSRLRLKKETVKDLDGRKKASDVRGGALSTEFVVPMPRFKDPVLVPPAPIRQR